jgi:hypothetical protein
MAYGVVDYFNDERIHPNIVTNPPYKIAQQIINHALRHCDGRVAILTQLKFLASQGRYGLFTDRRMEKVIIFSRRPSMPPGDLLMERGEEIRGGGSLDFCWLVWNVRRTTKAPPTIEWTM